MKIYLLDCNENIVEAWRKFFNEDNVEIVLDYFDSFMNKHKEIQGVVSPANSFGLMDGGYDAAITKYFGKDLMKKVQQQILRDCNGLQPIGSALSVPITENQYLIHVPTMIVPSPILDVNIIYQCMRVTLKCAEQLNLESIVIPAFGGLTGRVDADVIAEKMYKGYLHYNNVPSKLNWGYARFIGKELL